MGSGRSPQRNGRPMMHGPGVGGGGAGPALPPSYFDSLVPIAPKLGSQLC